VSNRDIEVRTREYALSIIRLLADLPKRTEAQVMGHEAFRSGTHSVLSMGERHEASPTPASSAKARRLAGIGGNRILAGIARRSRLIPEQRVAALSASCLYPSTLPSKCPFTFIFEVVFHILYPSTFILLDRLALTTRGY
jgi:hypothetical protein